MRQFRYIDDVEEWLRPMDYQGFWVATAPFGLTLQPRDHCDREIREGLVDEATVLSVLKSLAVLELTKRHKLKIKIPTPWLKLVETH